MGNIVLLDDLTINKIAAGEVIERPASVVKEVVENSIDANANNISVEIKNGGISYIRITDNGKGIPADDLEIAFERHATSKIRKAEDLEIVKTMGFRGEALASIAAIARVELVSKTEEDSIGHKIVVEGGRVISKEEVGCPKGTSITIENLFYNTPVRYKFLKKDFTESGYIEDAISRIALVNTNIAIKYVNEGKTIIQTSGNGSMKDVIYSIYGKDIAENIMNVEYYFEDMAVKGVIGNSNIARSNRTNQLFFVNKRYVKDKTLTSAAEQAFKGILPIGKYGFLILNIEMNPNQLDVNVHPAKLEVRFQEENKIFKLVYHAIKETLLKFENMNQNKIENQYMEEQPHQDYIDEIQKIENKMFDNMKIDDEENSIDKENESKGIGGFFKNILGGSKNEFTTNEDNLVEQLYRDKMQHEYEKNEEYKEFRKDETEINDIEPQNSTNLEKLVKELDANLEKLNLNTVSSKLDIFDKKENNLNELDKQNQNKSDEFFNDVLSGDVFEDDLSSSLEDYKKLENQNNDMFSNEENTIEGGKNVVSNNEYSNNNENDSEPDTKFEEMYAKMFGTVITNRNKLDEEQDKGYVIKQEDLKNVENLSLFSNDSFFNRPIYKYIGIVFGSYVVIEYEKEMYIIDQKAANERILYEKVKKNYYSDTEKDSQLMLLPDVINLTEKEMGIAKDSIELFRKAGFDLEEFGDKTIKLSGVPNICIDMDTRQLFIDILAEINTVARTARNEVEEKLISTIACKAAEKTAYAVTAQEVDVLMQQLLNLPHPFVSPNETPIAIRMSKIDIEKRFSRR